MSATQGEAPQPSPEQQPTPAATTVRVLRGNPTPVQVAALTTVLVAALAGAGDDRDGEATGDRLPRTLWTARSRFARPRPSVGPDGWRASTLPR